MTHNVNSMSYVNKHPVPARFTLIRSAQAFSGAVDQTPRGAPGTKAK